MIHKKPILIILKGKELNYDDLFKDAENVVGM